MVPLCWQQVLLLFEPVLGASVVADELVLPATGLEHGVVVTTMNFFALWRKLLNNLDALQ